MDYNFSSISVDAIESIYKKLRKVREDVIDNIRNFITVLNDQSVIEKHAELTTEVVDILNDEIKQSVIRFTQAMNKVQACLDKYL